jgi:hypothetical protein
MANMTEKVRVSDRARNRVSVRVNIHSRLRG